MSYAKARSLQRIFSIRTLTVAVCAFTTACSTPQKRILGRWHGVVTSETLEFFQDGKVATGGPAGAVTGNWVILDDGRVKVEVGMLGIGATFVGKIESDTLVVLTPQGFTAKYIRSR